MLLVAPCCWSQPHSLGDDRIVEQGVPALLDLPKGEAAAELHAQVDRCQVVGLQGPRWVGPSLRAGKNSSLASPRKLLGYFGGRGPRAAGRGMCNLRLYLQYSVDEQEVIRRLPAAQILGHLKRLFALLHTLGESGGWGWAGRHRSARGLGHLGRGQEENELKADIGGARASGLKLPIPRVVAPVPPDHKQHPQELGFPAPHPRSTSAWSLTLQGLLFAGGTLNPRVEGGWGGYQETTLTGTVSRARAMPPGGYFYTQQCWEQAVCSQNRCTLYASHTECDTGRTDRVCVCGGGLRQERGSREKRWAPTREAAEVGAGATGISHRSPLQGSCELAKVVGKYRIWPPPPCNRSPSSSHWRKVHSLNSALVPPHWPPSPG